MVAGLLTTIAFVLQVLKTWCTRSASDFSLPMLALFTVGIALWLAYGLLLHQMPITLPNIVTLVLTTYILLVKLKEV